MDITGQRRMTWDEFVSEFKPIQNYIDTQSTSWDRCLFETYGRELLFVQGADLQCVWTLTCRDNSLYISEGYQVSNRAGYIITKVPRQPDDNHEYIVDEDIWEAVEEAGEDG